jgi:lysozyme family protein
MTGDFDRAFSVVVGIEGGYTNDPRDPGGETKFGISKRSYPSLNISALTEDDAKAIYLRDYWSVMHCEQLPWPLNLYVFDSAVNEGQYATTRLLQSALKIQVDGIFGANTLHQAANATLDQCASFMTQRAFAYQKMQNWSAYGTGWFNRLFKVAGAA